MKKLLIIIIFVLSACLPSAPRMQQAMITNVPSSLYPTIQRCVDNTTVCNVAEGTYNEVVKLTKNEVTLQAYGRVIAKTIYVYSNNNVVRGFEFTNKNEKAPIRVMGNYNLIEDNEIYDSAEDCIWWWGKGNIFRGNYCHDIHDDRNWPGTDQHVDCAMTWDWARTESGFAIQPAQDTLFENNICDHNRAQGSNQSWIVTGSKTKNTTMRGNTLIMHDAGYSPIALYGGTGWLIENNYLCNTTGRGQDAVWVEGAQDVRLINNTWTGYSSLLHGSATMSGNVKGTLPCVSDITPAPVTPTMTQTRTPTMTATRTVTMIWTPSQTSTMTKSSKPTIPPTFTATAIETPSLCVKSVWYRTLNVRYEPSMYNITYGVNITTGAIVPIEGTLENSEGTWAQINDRMFFAMYLKSNGRTYATRTTCP